MKVDLRILAIVTVFLVMAASAIVLVRFIERGSSVLLLERIASKGAATTEQIPGGLMLQVHANGVTLALPNCTSKGFEDKFFLHVYAEKDQQESPAKFTNMDFELVPAEGKTVKFNGANICTFSKTFAQTPVREISIGQFTTPGGRCCDIIWSRSFLLNASLQPK